MSRKPIAPDVMDGLKDFQRATVEYVFSRMYTDTDPVHRFLVADEVGLGKTLVARGLIARTIDRLRDQGVRRIDVIYICSNADIAQQNIRKLNVTGQKGLDHSTRITLLPTILRQLKGEEINFVSFTPGTAFSMGDRAGRMDERALVYWLLRHAWGSRRLQHSGVFRLLRASAGAESFEGYVKGYRHQRVGRGPDRIDPDIADRFRTNLLRRDDRDRGGGLPTIRERFDAVAGRLRNRDRHELWHERQALVGELRGILARSAVDALEPDLIILDEFQRFRHLLEDPEDEDDTRTLARQLFDYESDDGHARTLLLSATPYKMYTVADEASHDDHYADFVKTTEFLLGAATPQFRRELTAYREAFLDVALNSSNVLKRRKRAVEDRLRGVMTRTERLASTTDRSGMLHQRPMPADHVLPADTRAFVSFDAVSQRLGSRDTVEYWKSAPYPLSFMEGYEVKRRLRDAVETDPAAAADVAKRLSDGVGLVDPALVEAYRELDPGNARLRALAGDMLESEAWRLLWIPPSLPYYAPRGPFRRDRAQDLTKRLVFSSWTVVPQAVASILSYEAERRMMLERDPRARNTLEARRKLRSLLQFRRADGRAAAMSAFALVYPSAALARLTDPLKLAGRRDNGGRTPSADAVLRMATESVKRVLRPLVKDSPREGPPDENWYWAAPILLEGVRDAESVGPFFGRSAGDLAKAWTAAFDARDGDDLDSFATHIDRARTALMNAEPLGRPPDDLEEVLAALGLAGPANVALRALSRGPNYERDLSALEVRDAACRVAWGFRALFGIPEVMAMIRGRSGTERAYWRRVLQYCLDGNLQAVMDEYGHVLPEWMGIINEPPRSRAGRVADGIHEALTIRAPRYGYDAIRSDGEVLTIEGMRLRARFALRFGVDSRDEAENVQRSSQVRAAFNSPFWPFVLVTTSVGQEGLDFHQYCHAVVHWNLPANPVDFEQREGRVHRYKGHAVRRNVAAAHRREALRPSVRDPWAAMFDAARRSRQARGRGDVVPYWIYEGRHTIERYVPMLPLSREIEQLERLKRSLAVYRLVFGQPRQEDLAAYLADRLSAEELAERRDALRIDLSPPRAPRPKAASGSI